MSIPVLQVNKDFRQTFVSSSKGDQLKWKMGNLWGKANKFGYEGLAEWGRNPFWNKNKQKRNGLYTAPTAIYNNPFRLRRHQP